jgi:hypothetical protein
MLRATICSILLLVTPVSSAFGDVVELKSGERIEGKFKQATSAGVVIEVGDQPITMPLEKVRAIYFGSAPDLPASAQQASPVHEALTALKALQSVTTVGVNYRDYASRVLDTKVKVDQFLQSPKENSVPGRDAIRLAMRYYELASQAWGSKISSGADSYQQSVNVGHTLAEDKEISACPAVQQLVATSAKTPPPKGAKSNAEFQFFFIAFEVGGRPAILWRCASDKIADAESSMK